VAGARGLRASSGQGNKQELSMPTALSHAIKFGGNMDTAVQFHVAHLGLKLRFQSPEWDGAEFSVSGT